MKFTLNIFEDFICFLGSKIETDFHQHYATTIVLSRRQTFTITTHDNFYSSNFCILPPNYYHCLNANEVDDLIIIYIEPDSKYSYFFKQSRGCDSKIRLEEKICNIEQTFLNKNQEFDDFKVIEFLKTHSNYESAGQIDTRISKTFQYAKHHLNGNLNGQTLAQQVHLSESRFRHLFKEEAGISISKYLQWVRLKEVAALILQGNDLIEASHYAGFYDGAHFNRVFKEMFGIPPSKVLK